MNGEELGQLLALIAGYDDRFLNPDSATLGAWSRALRREELGDCVPPVDAWFARPRERRIMTGDVAEPAKLARQRRVAFTQEQERHDSYQAVEAAKQPGTAAVVREVLSKALSASGPEHTPIEDPLEVAARYDGRKITPDMRAEWRQRIPPRVSRRFCTEAIDDYYRNRATRDRPIRILDVLAGVEAIINQRLARRADEERAEQLNPRADVSPFATPTRIREIFAAEAERRRRLVARTMADRAAVQEERLAFFSQLTAAPS